MTSTTLVTGGTGTIGRLVVPLLRDAGHAVRVLSRRGGRPADGVEHVTGDLLQDRDIAALVRGCDTVLHLAGGPKGDDVATRHLVHAAAGTGVRHLVLISVIGAATMPIGYFRAKRGAEEAVTAVPWTTVRVAQLHDLAYAVVSKLARLPVIPVPRGLRFQPVDAHDVAARLVELTLGGPAGLVPDLAGPRTYDLAELTRAYLRATGRRRPLLPVRLPGAAGRAYRAGDNLARAGATTGTRTWEEFLAVSGR